MGCIAAHGREKEHTGFQKTCSWNLPPSPSQREVGVLYAADGRLASRALLPQGAMIGGILFLLVFFPLTQGFWKEGNL
jgi:hypothetical protein